MLLVDRGRSLESARAPFEETLGVIAQRLLALGIAQRLLALGIAALLDCSGSLSVNLAEKLLFASGYLQLLVQVRDDLGEDVVDEVFAVLVDGGTAFALLANILVEFL